MEFQIVQTNFQYEPEKLNEPSKSGYIHIAAEVQPSNIPFKPISAEKSSFLKKLKAFAPQLEQLEIVEQVTVYDAAAIPPFDKFPDVRERKNEIHIPRFDISVLVETKSPSDIKDVQNTPVYRELMEFLKTATKQLHIMAAENAKRLRDVDWSREGTFLFNHFVADDREVMLKLWDYLAGWYREEMGIDNSLLLVPVPGETSDYLAVNHARIKGNAIAFVARQMTKKSFKEYFVANLYANRVVAMPILYKLI